MARQKALSVWQGGEPGASGEAESLECMAR